MMRFLLASALAVFSTLAHAQQPSTAVPTTRPVPENIVAYVKQQAMPGNPVMVSEKIAVGQPLPANLVLTPVPNSTTYSYAVVNQQRVIVDPANRNVLHIIE